MLKLLSPALFAALLAALVLSLAQALWISPLILQAEVFESDPAQPVDADTGHHHEDHAAHEHDESAWAPEDGWQRHAATLASNLVMAVGYGLILCACYAWAFHAREGPAGWRPGLVWGAAGYAVFFLAPALGLPPELPGTLAAKLEARQLWWLLTALCTATGLALLAWARPLWLKLAALLPLVLPHVLGAPHPEHVFALAPEMLTWKFIVATSLVNALFWLMLGAISAQLFVRSQRGDDVALRGIAL